MLQTGTYWRVTAPYTPAQDLAERASGIIIIIACTMLIYASLPANLWLEAVAAAAYIINRLLTKHLGWKTPFKATTSHLLSFAHIRIYSYYAYYHLKAIKGHLAAPKRTYKMAPRAHIGYLVG